MQLDREKVVVKDHSSSGGIIWTTMKSRTIQVGTRRAERGAEQEDEEDGRLSAPTVSLQSWFLTKKQSAVLISASTQVLIAVFFIAVFFISASNMFLYRRLHGVPDAASTPGLMSFDPLRRCPASCLGAVAMLYPDKEEKCIWRNEGITIVKQELKNQLERWDGGNASGEETK